MEKISGAGDESIRIVLAADRKHWRSLVAVLFVITHDED